MILFSVGPKCWHDWDQKWWRFELDFFIINTILGQITGVTEMSPALFQSS